MKDVAVRMREDGLTVREIAAELGVARATVGDWVTGIDPLPRLVEEPDPDAERLQRLSAWCSRCQQRKPWAMFWARAKWPDGTMRLPQSYCRDCVKARRRELRAMDPSAARARDRRDYEAMMNDPDRAAKRRETQRQNSVAFRRRTAERRAA